LIRCSCPLFALFAFLYYAKIDAACQAKIARVRATFSRRRPYFIDTIAADFLPLFHYVHVTTPPRFRCYYDMPCFHAYAPAAAPRYLMPAAAAAAMPPAGARCLPLLDATTRRRRPAPLRYLPPRC